MLVNVNSALKRDEIRKLLEANENPKYVYVKNLSPMEMQFEATYKEGTDGNPADYAKKLIKSQPWGGVQEGRKLFPAFFVWMKSVMNT